MSARVVDKWCDNDRTMIGSDWHTGHRTRDHSPFDAIFNADCWNQIHWELPLKVMQRCSIQKWINDATTDDERKPMPKPTRCFKHYHWLVGIEGDTTLRKFEQCRVTANAIAHYPNLHCDESKSVSILGKAASLLNDLPTADSNKPTNLNSLQVYSAL